MKTHSKIIVEPQYHGKRLDQFLTVKFPTKSRNGIQLLIKKGSILVNNNSVIKSTKVHMGDLIDIVFTQQLDRLPADDSVKFSVIFEDDHILVINKPSQLSVHPGAGNQERTLINGLLSYDLESFQPMIDEQKRPGIVHRLDKDTTGVMVIAKNNEAKNTLISHFKSKKVTKTYLAFVRGIPQEPKGCIKTLIGRNQRYRHKMAVVREKGKEAETRYEILSSGKNCSLLRVGIRTGRTHQIRVHLAHLNHSILGDKVYCRKKDGVSLAGRPMLHAWNLKFPHPATNNFCSFVAELPSDFLEIIDALGLPLENPKICFQS